MKRFLKNIAILSIGILILHIFFAFVADGTTDKYYMKVTANKKKSLIIGKSRATYGLMPSVLDSVLEISEKDDRFFNFAFTLPSSSYGKVYLEALQKKVDTNTKEGIFILEVDPWGVSDIVSDSNLIPDQKSVLYNLNHVSGSPNFEYLIKKYPHGWGRILLDKLQSKIIKKYNTKLNQQVNGSFSEMQGDGWLRVYASLDSSFVRKKTTEKAERYKKFSKDRQFSITRYKYLLRTIQLLKSHGEVYLVRLPIDIRMLEVENSYMPNFEQIFSTAIQESDGFVDFTKFGDKYSYLDGNHLTSESAKEVSIAIGKEINKIQNITN